MRRLFHCSLVFLGYVLLFNPTLAHPLTEDRICRIEASGEGCIYDLVANANGTLTTCTKTARPGVRWRASAAQANIPMVQSNVGNGSATAFTGCVSRPVFAGGQYEVIVTYERPLPGTFPIFVTTRINAPVNSIPNNRPLSIVEIKSCKQITEPTLALAAVDEETIACGALLRCRLAPAADTDTFKYLATAGHAVNVRVTELPSVDIPGCTGWTFHGPNGEVISSNFFSCDQSLTTPSLPGSGNYAINVSNNANSIVDYILSLQGVSQSSQCGTPISYGNVKTGRLEVWGDSDTFSFVGLTSQAVNIKVTENSNVPGCTGWVLYGPNGQLIGSNFFSCDASLTTSPLPVSGTYTLLVSNNAHSVIDYKVLATKVSGP